jgi:hypothetical protein
MACPRSSSLLPRSRVHLSCSPRGARVNKVTDAHPQDPRFFHDSLVHVHISSVPRRRTSRINTIGPRPPTLSISSCLLALDSSHLPRPVASFFPLSTTCNHARQRKTRGAPRAPSGAEARMSIRTGWGRLGRREECVAIRSTTPTLIVSICAQAHPQSSPSPLSRISAPKLHAFVYRDGGRGEG